MGTLVVDLGFSRETVHLRSFSLECLPAYDISQHAEPPTSQSSEMDVGRPIVKPEGLTDEGLPTRFGERPESFGIFVRRLREGGFGRSREVDASEKQMTSLSI